MPRQIDPIRPPQYTPLLANPLCLACGRLMRLSRITRTPRMTASRSALTNACADAKSSKWSRWDESPPLTVSDVRRWADRCGADAEEATDAATRDRLLKMQTALLILARNDDWRRADADSVAAADAKLQAAL